MTTWFITRHAGARDWVARKGIVAEVRDHLDPTMIKAGDRVMGTLPVYLAAEVCARGAAYLHLTMQTPEAWRGRDLTADEMESAQARLERFDVRKLEETI